MNKKVQVRRHETRFIRKGMGNDEAYEGSPKMKPKGISEISFVLFCENTGWDGHVQEHHSFSTTLQWRAFAIQPCFGHRIAFEEGRQLLPYLFVICIRPPALVGGEE